MAPFRLFDLPQEIQDNVYAKYFEDAMPALFSADDCDWNCNKFDVQLHDFVIVGIPSLAIESLSRKVSGDARKARDRAMTSTLLLEMLNCDRGEQVFPFCNDIRYIWLGSLLFH